MAEFKNWQYTTTMDGNGKETSNNASLAELILYFGKMTVLEIGILSIEYLPKELRFSNSNLRFRINVKDDGSYLFKNAISLQREGASDLGKIMEIAISRGVFGNLIDCRIVECNRSENIFWLTMVRDLVQLKWLDIIECENIQEIFSNEGDQDMENVFGGVITLSNLEKIQLRELPWLVGICKSMDSIEVEAGGNTSLATLSNKLFSSITILWFPNLVDLFVQDCRSLEVVFDLKGLEEAVLSQLRSLYLSNLDGMTHVWKNIPSGFQGFQNLISINIMCCNHFRSLLPSSVAKLLVQLQTVYIDHCKLMENIIQREEEAGQEEEKREDIIVFPKINSFELKCLKNLVSFSVEAHSFEWLSIKKIKLSDCPNLKTFGSEVHSKRKVRKNDAELYERAPQEPSAGSSSASTSTKKPSRLFNRYLELSCVRRCKNYNPSQGNCSSSLKENKHSYNKEVTLTKQDEPYVRDIENQIMMWSLFPYNLIESLENLEELYAEECGSLEVIFEVEGLNVEESNYIFSNLTDLRLYGLRKMLHIWKKGPRDIKGFNNLRLLEVKGCDSLKYVFTPSIAKLLVKLEEIEAWNCKEMKEIIGKEWGDEEKRDHVIAFPQLNTLTLGFLPKLECLCNDQVITFDWPSLGNITSMKTPNALRIAGDLNTTIQHIENSSSSLGDKNKHNINKEVTLTKQDEPNVSDQTENQTKTCSLFPYNFIKSLENLEKLTAWYCDSLEVIFEVEGLNHVEESKIFNNLRELSLWSLQKLLHIWKKGPGDIKGFNNLRLLKVSSCHSLKYLFTPSIARILVKLEEIEVFYCSEMKEIIAKLEWEDKEKRDDVIVFPQLKTLTLSLLPKLECFCNEALIAFEWPSLEKMRLYKCKKLKMFVSTSIKTPKLQEVAGDYGSQPMIDGDLNTTIQHIIKEMAKLQESSENESPENEILENESSESSRSP